MLGIPATKLVLNTLLALLLRLQMNLDAWPNHCNMILSPNAALIASFMLGVPYSGNS